MIFLHIVDDYYLQGILASMKQKKWWNENAPSDLYKNDYICALITHGFSWTFMVMLPIAFAQNFNINTPFVIAFFLNWAIHASVDHAKANLLRINLITDQLIHLLQICLTSTLLFL